MPVATDFDDYEWLRKECEYRLTVKEPGFVDRAIIDPGDVLYDPQLCWAEADGSVVMSDIGGQRERGWNPDEGYGAIWRVLPDDRLEPIVPPGNMGNGMPIRPAKAPDHFGAHGGDIFFVGQTVPGRAGAHRPHAVYRVPQGTDRPEIFAEVPHAGTRGDGVPGGMITGAFGKKGTEHEGYLFIQTQMNCAVYRVDAGGKAEPYLVLDEPYLPHSINPYLVFYAPPQAGPLAGELLLCGIQKTSFEGPAKPRLNLEYWKIAPQDAFDVQPVTGVRWGTSAAVAPPGFGPFGGQLFVCDTGTTNVLQNAKPPEGPLPYDAKVIRIDDEGAEHVFVDGLQGFTTVLFQGPRMLISSVRRSYSTGEYHEPDGSLAEITLA